MRYKFTLSDESVPWAQAEAPIVAPLSMPMDAADEALSALKWTLADLQALIRRSTIAHFERLAQRQGKEYTGEPSNLTGKDEILINQLIAFGTLRKAGYQISWPEACVLPLDAFHVVPETAGDEAMIAAHEDETDDEQDPQTPSTGSAPAVAGATLPASEPTGLQ